ncbi:MAG: 5-methyltetrahydropteroyltriglutamate--homocysteine S-methyltransferase [Planctomycetota bacterium]|jgi:5-methyltetrahydropteroyltriglutamate--homocysteine methyltransferase|nr:5-methyltetrahydropteroyltriglutamate--homocysteine S-methyltransferase [Planctomycetota bacterium]
METHVLGFPRIGRNRELKFALEAHWRGELAAGELEAAARELKQRHWRIQRDAGLDYVAVGDFSLYDQMLDATLMIGAVPGRFSPLAGGPEPDLLFAMARGDAGRGIPALEMTKWFDTNYHYLVPELPSRPDFRPGGHPAVADAGLARELGFTAKAVLIGPFTWIALAKARGEGLDKWSLLPPVLDAYKTTLAQLARHCPIIQVDEPILCTDWLPAGVPSRFASAYGELKAAASGARLMLATYFGALGGSLEPALAAGCDILHLDLKRGPEQLDPVLAALPRNQVLSLGVVDGRNVWKNNFAETLPLVEKAVSSLGGERVMLGTSCSLLHCPVDLEGEDALPEPIRDRLAFAAQKCGELAALRRLAGGGDRCRLAANREILERARAHPDARIEEVGRRCAAATPEMLRRASAIGDRRAAQAWLGLPPFPATTIGSFPQTPEIRRARRDRKRGELSEEGYREAIRKEIGDCVRKQEELGLDVLVHGEAERNDMVEYFGERLKGFCFTQNGWVQSYGSRCVKPPIIHGDVRREGPMTLEWSLYAQSLTRKPVKGMLTGPVTILAWSFVRDDLERSEVCKQIALAIRDEVGDLERAGIRVIQIDEAALREGMPLTAEKAGAYLRWAVDSFRLASSGVADSTQIHTHMCYSEFNAILPWIAEMDADVISVESSRGGMELLDAFDGFNYPGAVGPGVYDIHSPRVPSEEEILGLLEKALKHIDKGLLWVNPDCGLKTRRWSEVMPSLENMMAAARKLRAREA